MIQPIPTETHIYYVIDDSGSMAGWSELIRGQLNVIQTPENYSQFYIGFSNKAIFSENLSSIPIQHCSTEIGYGIECLLTEICKRPFPKKLITVFISDGCDNNSQTINSRINGFGKLSRSMGPDIPCVLFTVAVGNYFPTTMVTDALRPNYHSASEYLPLIFPLKNYSDVPIIFEKLNNYIFNKDHFKNDIDVTVNSGLTELTEAVDDVYNYYTIKATAKGVNSETSITLLTEAKEKFELIKGYARKIESEKEKNLKNVSDQAKPLASRLLSKIKIDRKDIQTKLTEMLEQTNILLETVKRGKLLSGLSDIDKQNVLGYGNVVGKHLTKSLKYNSADFNHTLTTLVSYLSGYNEDDNDNKSDELVTDSIITQKESILDAKSVLSDIRCLDNFVQIVETFPFIGRLINIKKCAGTQINPYLLEIDSVPTVFTVLNSIDFFTRYKGEYVSNNLIERANCIIPIVKNKNSFFNKQIGWHLATYSLCRNIELVFPTAFLGMQAALVVWCLSNRNTEYIGDILDETYQSYMCTYTESFKLNKYINKLKTDEFRQCLITYSKDLDTTCEHLTKFVFGMYINIKQGYKYTSLQLKNYMIALLVETVGRQLSGTETYLDFIDYKSEQSTSEILNDTLLKSDALSKLTLPDARDTFETDVKNGNFNVKDYTLISEVPDKLNYFQFSQKSIKSIFTRLNELCDNETIDLDLDPIMITSIIKKAKLGSFERNNSSDVENIGSIETELIRIHRNKVLSECNEFISKVYTDNNTIIHDTEAFRMPPEYIQRFLRETGKDINLDFGVNNITWLPTNVCSCKKCPWFMKRLSPVKYHIESNLPVITDIVQNHLLVTQQICGYTKTIALNKTLTPEQIEMKILSGCNLNYTDENKKSAVVERNRVIIKKHDETELINNISDIKNWYTDYQNKLDYTEFKKTMDLAYSI